MATTSKVECLELCPDCWDRGEGDSGCETCGDTRFVPGELTEAEAELAGLVGDVLKLEEA